MKRKRGAQVRLHQVDRHGTAGDCLREGLLRGRGLYVTLEAQANWKVLLDGVIDGQLDGAHMLAGQPLAATIGFGTKAHIVTPFRWTSMATASPYRTRSGSR